MPAAKRLKKKPPKGYGLQEIDEGFLLTGPPDRKHLLTALLVDTVYKTRNRALEVLEIYAKIESNYAAREVEYNVQA